LGSYRPVAVAVAELLAEQELARGSDGAGKNLHESFWDGVKLNHVLLQERIKIKSPAPNQKWEGL